MQTEKHDILIVKSGRAWSEVPDNSSSTLMAVNLEWMDTMGSSLLELEVAQNGGASNSLGGGELSFAEDGRITGRG